MDGKFLTEENQSKMNEKLAYLLTTTVSSLFIIIGNVSLFVISLILAIAVDLIYCVTVRWKNFKLKDVADKLIDSTLGLFGYIVIIIIAGIVDHSAFGDNLFNIDNFLVKLVSLICLSLVLRSIEKTHIIAGGKRFKTYFNKIASTFKMIKKIIINSDDKDSK